MWEKVGDFNKKYESDDPAEGFIDRAVTYFHSGPNTTIFRLSLRRYTTGDLQLSLLASCFPCFYDIKEMITKAGFKAPNSMDERCRTYYLETKDKSVISTFINQVIKIAQPDFTEIEHDISSSLMSVPDSSVRANSIFAVPSKFDATAVEDKVSSFNPMFG